MITKIFATIIKHTALAHKFHLPRLGPSNDPMKMKGDNAVENMGKLNKILTVMLLGASIVATVTIMPWTGVFPEFVATHWLTISMLVLVWIGCLGWILRVRALCGAGVYGSYFYLFLVLITVIPVDDDDPLPVYVDNIELMALRLLFLSFVTVALIASFRLGMRQIRKSIVEKYEDMLVEKVGKSKKTLTVLLFVFSGIATVTLMPWAGLFDTFLINLLGVFIPVFLFAGGLGWISRISKCCALGIIGGYTYFFMVMISFLPPEDKGTYSIAFLIARLLGLAFIAVVLIGFFRIGTRYIQIEKAAQIGIIQGKEDP